MIVLGLMSGTSLDGVDLAVCRVTDYDCRVLNATTIPYDKAWQDRLSNIEKAKAIDYALTDVELGRYFGRIINEYLSDCDVVPDAIASHGHTVFHQPHRGLTTQIGNGDAIAAETGLTVVCGFRTLDVALGGQGAPLVPVGDELLYGQYDACLNLGGIANISFRHAGQRLAFDICPCNMVLNHLSRRIGMPFDNNGENARMGSLVDELEARLNALEYYRLAPPKSLGKEWFVGNFLPLIEKSSLPVKDCLRTSVEHIARQISTVLMHNAVGNVLVTGGGAHNSYLIERLNYHAPDVRIVVPDDMTVDYKEAAVFAYLGYLRLMGKVNTLASVTGARCDSCGGMVCGKTIR